MRQKNPQKCKSCVVIAVIAILLVLGLIIGVVVAVVADNDGDPLDPGANKLEVFEASNIQKTFFKKDKILPVNNNFVYAEDPSLYANENDEGSACISLDDPVNYLSYSDTTLKPGTLLVSIASYRDDECSTTIKQIFEKAHDPSKIFVALVQQNKAEFVKEDCLYNCAICREKLINGQIRRKHLGHLKARGPCFARYIASKMSMGEEYYVQIDSHTNFVQDWDKILWEQIRATGDPKAVIGAYPPTEGQLNEFKKSNFSRTISMCAAHFNHDGIPELRAHIVSSPQNRKPFMIPFLGANLMAIPLQALIDVPFDPYLNYLFFGEEILYSIRLWTNGYNMYAPIEAFCTHHYGRHDKPKYWTDHSKFQKCKHKAVQRVKFFLGILPMDKVPKDYRYDLSVYGPGNVRSLKSYYDFAYISMKNKKMSKRCFPGAYKI
jgi:hypothetical protein